MSASIERTQALLEQAIERVGADATRVDSIVAEICAYPFGELHELLELLELLAVTQHGMHDYSVLGAWGERLGLDPYKVTASTYLTALLTQRAEHAKRVEEYAQAARHARVLQALGLMRPIAEQHGFKIVHIPEDLPDGRKRLRFDTLRLVDSEPNADKDPKR